jgi:capsular polysaccharide biosynthesis protein
VEASEAIRRIFWRHRWLLLILLIVPAVGVVALREHQPVAYSASASVQGQGTTPDAQTQVSAIQSRVTAVATDPVTVHRAITAAGVKRDSISVAKNDVSVSPLGSSAVMVLTVTDPSRPAAVKLAGSLATVVVRQLNQIGVQDNPELSKLNASILQLTNRRNKLVSELDNATASGVQSTSVQAQSLLAQLSATEQELATEESTSQQILSTLSANTGASVVSTPSTASGASRHAVTYGALAAVLGLVLGLLFASLREIIRPTIAQPSAGARELGTIPLGNATVAGDRITGIDDDISVRLSLTAQRAGASTIVLTGPCSGARLAALADTLNRDLPGGRPGRESAVNIGTGHPVGLHDRRLGIRVVALPDIRLGERPHDAALVVVLTAFAPRRSLDEAADLSAATDWPILGVIGLRRRGWFGRDEQARRGAGGGAEPGRDGTLEDTVEMERTHD